MVVEEPTVCRTLKFFILSLTVSFAPATDIRRLALLGPGQDEGIHAEPGLAARFLVVAPAGPHVQRLAVASTMVGVADGAAKTGQC